MHGISICTKLPYRKGDKWRQLLVNGTTPLITVDNAAYASDASLDGPYDWAVSTIPGITSANSRIWQMLFFPVITAGQNDVQTLELIAHTSDLALADNAAFTADTTGTRLNIPMSYLIASATPAAYPAILVELPIEATHFNFRQLAAGDITQTLSFYCQVLETGNTYRHEHHNNRG